MFRIKFLPLFILCHVVKNVSTVYMIDSVNVITLPTNVIEIVQLPNSSIIIEYSNLTFVTYDYQFHYLAKFTLSNTTVVQQLSSDTNNRILMGISKQGQNLLGKSFDAVTPNVSLSSNCLFYHVQTRTSTLTYILVGPNFI